MKWSLPLVKAFLAEHRGIGTGKTGVTRCILEHFAAKAPPVLPAKNAESCVEQNSTVAA